MRLSLSLFLVLLSACTPVAWHAPSEFNHTPIDTGIYTITTYSRLTDSTSPVHIYIEGDGHAFNARGMPTSDPTPVGTFMRDMASYDASPNVVYMARPCQYTMTPTCRQSAWTDGRFSESVIKSMATAIQTVAQNRPIILIGYSGGAMVSGLVIAHNPDLNIQKWITIAGVLNHSDWTEYFNDAPLTRSLNLDVLPNVPQHHYIATGDRVVPNVLSEKWTSGKSLTYIHGATHKSFPKSEIIF